MADKVLAVFTSRTIERMCSEGGSQAWTFSAVNARECQWLICVWNARGAYAESGADHLEHREAFLIAPIDAIDASAQEPDRWIVRFHKYARISIPNAWNGQRLPFRYLTLDKFGLAPEALQFIETATLGGSSSPQQMRPKATPLSIEAAKIGLAAKFNVSPEAVEITIRG
jgi:hypothetical protein